VNKLQIALANLFNIKLFVEWRAFDAKHHSRTTV
jgi:hypothetical protein